MTNATTTCDACGTRYAFTNYKTDGCPVCCPVDEDEQEEYDLVDVEPDDD